jgi:hypothetical protein
MLRTGMIEKVRRWYSGNSVVETFENDPSSTIFIAPMVYTDYHWTAKLARALVGFYLRHWQWVWSTVLTLAGLWLAVLALR